MQGEKFLSAEQVLLTTLVVKLAVYSKDDFVRDKADLLVPAATEHVGRPVPPAPTGQVGAAKQAS